MMIGHGVNLRVVIDYQGYHVASDLDLALLYAKNKNEG